MASSSIERTKMSGWRVAILLSSIVWLANTNKVAAEQYSGRVVGIADADTITVLDSSNRQHKIRLLYIDVPERKQPFGAKAKQFLSDMIFNEEVTIAGTKRDRYRRELAKVAFQSKDVGLELIRRGYAWHFKRYAHEQLPEEHAQYSDGEREARKSRIGLWANVTPVPPWEWRAAIRQEKKPARAAHTQP